MADSSALTTEDTAGQTIEDIDPARRFQWTSTPSLFR